MDKIIIWGGTGQAIVIEELLMHYDIEIAAVFENNIDIPSPFPGIPIFYKEEGFKSWLSTVINKEDFYFLVAIGGTHGKVRKGISEMLEQAGLKPYTAIHTTAFIAKNAIIGKGVQILANSSICARTKIGDYCIINTGADVDHECVIGDHVHISAEAMLSGRVIVEDNVFIGVNSTVLPDIRIGENSIVGAGAVVIKDVPANCVVVGNPARILGLKN